MKLFLKFSLIAFMLLVVITVVSMRPIINDYKNFAGQVKKYQVVDKADRPLNVTYSNDWNLNDFTPLHGIPEFLQEAFIFSEDRKFYSHYGVDWKARGAALYQNVKAMKSVRGASTISEQAVKMLHPRGRNVWSRWVEGFESYVLEHNLSKPEIFEFYLNQVPYAAKRRGVVQGARYYFNRDLSTLNKKEMLALVVMPRSPSWLDMYKRPAVVEKSILRLAGEMKKAGLLTEEDYAQIKSEKLNLRKGTNTVEASNFVNYISQEPGFNISSAKLPTTLDADKQRMVQEILDQRLKSLTKKNVGNAGALVVDNKTGQIIAWVVGGSADDKTAYNKIDAVITPRQPGSALKPFLYALALESGWTAATVIDDSPYSESIGQGLHNFRNYSRSFYGKVTLREALGNSLNIPALHTIKYVGASRYLDLLHMLGFHSLDKAAEFYNDGLALGNGEVTLFELVQAYATLANNGKFRPLVGIRESNLQQRPVKVYSEEVASLIGNILSDPWARRLEFGEGSVLNFPVQTAVKTGTSTDYRDAWAVGFNRDYTVGIWMGNLDRKPMDGVTGSTGPALALRSVFAELAKTTEPRKLYLSPRLALKDTCIDYGQGGCVMRSEYFVHKGHNLSVIEMAALETQAQGIEIVRPTEGLEIAIDPRIPADKQAFQFVLSGPVEKAYVTWMLNGKKLATTAGGKYMWKLEAGKYDLQAIVMSGGETSITRLVRFRVK